MIYFYFSLIILFFLGFSLYASKSLKTLKVSNAIIYLFNIITVLIACNLVWLFTNISKITWEKTQSYSIAIFIIWFLVLTTISFVLLLEDITRITRFIFRIKRKYKHLEGRRKFISLLGLGLAAIPFSSLLFGIFKGKYNYKVLKYTLYFDDLPTAFDGYKITQISDLHSGSFDNKEKIQYGVELINEQKSDVIFFTGDLVNNIATEMLPWKKIFKQLNASDGLFSILGNHDYGDYYHWDSKEDKEANFQQIKNIHKEIGFKLLLNEHVYLEKDQQKLALIGVENWGAGRFSKHGDLNKALAKVKDEDFKILLSHDPTHWEYIVLPEKKNIHLTLSGHTHGMQFGIEIPGWFRFSPSQWIYKYWAGMYEENGKFLNVNRGFGFNAFPGRVGIWPEITVITLKKKEIQV